MKLLRRCARPARRKNRYQVSIAQSVNIVGAGSCRALEDVAQQLYIALYATIRQAGLHPKNPVATPGTTEVSARMSVTLDVTERETLDTFLRDRFGVHVRIKITRD